MNKKSVTRAFQYIVGAGLLSGAILIANQHRKEEMDNHRAVKATWDHNGASEASKAMKLNNLPDVCESFNTAHAVSLSQSGHYVVCLNEDFDSKPKVIKRKM